MTSATFPHTSYPSPTSASSPQKRTYRVACIYFPISSVGGINTEVTTFRRAAAQFGDRLDVLSCPNQRTKNPRLFSKPVSVRGGDTRITIHGEVSHHADRIAETVAWLEANYDGLFFIHPCPHPTKAYGDVPYWGKMYTDVKLPKVTRFVDAYYESYRWIDPYLPECRRVFVNQPAYAIPIQHLNPTLLPKPFLPVRTHATRSATRHLVWTSQWKKIKGIYEFIRVLPNLLMPVDLYSNGIEYYQMRGGEDFNAAVGRDHFERMDHAGRKDHVFHGYVPLERIPEILAHTWAMVDLQGYKSRYAAYTEGSYNNTTVEALWYGAWPIVHRNASKGPLPKECLVLVDTAEDIVKWAKTMRPMPPDVHERAQAWVRGRHNALKVYGRIRQELFG